jgi:hypothetical protein
MWLAWRLRSLRPADRGGFRRCLKLSERRRPRMKIQIRKRRVEVSDALRAYVERRLGFALGRFGDRLGPITVRFSDVNGHRGGVDKRCQIHVDFMPPRKRAGSGNGHRAVRRPRPCGAPGFAFRREGTQTRSEDLVASPFEARRTSDLGRAVRLWPPTRPRLRRSACCAESALLFPRCPFRSCRFWSPCRSRRRLLH